jgi:hypothetical protein
MESDLRLAIGLSYLLVLRRRLPKMQRRHRRATPSGIFAVELQRTDRFIIE